MCGIAGIVGGGVEEVEGLLTGIRSRGPDARNAVPLTGIGAALGHVRLSIIDLDSRSDQPFASGDGRFLLSYNGEIYNYVELRSELERKGVSFRTSSDTEVLLRWMIRHGTDRLDDLDGMFAFALADRETGRWTLVRDRIGEKPLYYATGPGRRFAFCSEIGPLTGLGWVDTSLDEEALRDFVRYLYTPAPTTLYRGIRELEPGTYLTVDAREGDFEVSRYYSLDERVRERRLRAPAADRDHALEGFRRRFRESVVRRLRSDVPVGVYLSGGLDSNAIVAQALEVAPEARVETFTIRYEGSALASSVDESDLARRCADFFGVPNHRFPFPLDRDLPEALDRVVDLFGQPFGNATALVADQLAEQVSGSHRVCMVGDGGDEVLVGYPRYHALLRHGQMSRLPAWLVRGAGGVLGRIGEAGVHGRTVRRLRMFAEGLARTAPEAFLDWSTYASRESLTKALGPGGETAFTHRLLRLFGRNADDPLLAAALVDLASFVPYNLMQSADRTGMAHSLELRSPFLAPPLLEETLSLAPSFRYRRRRIKPLLVDAIRDRLPPFLLDVPKQGFNPPVGAYLRGNLALLRSHVLGPGSRCPEVLRRAFLEEELDAFAGGARDNSTFLWGLATLESWLRHR
ncbi:MAG: asparagine synthase (glutamine-hydrolyzing) [Gemmatimonadota bacterium]|jgi:asparagine synthase (glutamine-hydrolysing)